MTEHDIPRGRPGLTACVLCAGETLEGVDERPDGQLGRLRDLAARRSATLHETECLDECNRGDVLVVRPSPEGRRCGGRPVWFSALAGDADTASLEQWLADGGPGSRPVPQALTPKAITRGG